MTLTAVAVHNHKFDRRGTDNVYRCSCGLSLREYCERNIYGHKRKGAGIGRPKKKLKDTLKVKLKEITTEQQPDKEANMTLNGTVLTSVPPRPENKSPHSINKWIQQNKAAICFEISAMGEAATQARWKISRNAWDRFCRLNNIAVNREYYKRKPHIPKADKPPIVKPENTNKTGPGINKTGVIIINRELPAFPKFEACTSPQERTAWLVSYAEMMKASQVPATIEAK